MARVVAMPMGYNTLIEMTRVIVAHRPETIATADRFIILGVVPPSAANESRRPGAKAAGAAGPVN